MQFVIIFVDIAKIIVYNLVMKIRVNLLSFSFNSGDYINEKY